MEVATVATEWLGRAIATSEFHDRDQYYALATEDDLPGMLEIDRDAPLRVRLHLPRAPVRPRRVAHQIAGRKQSVRAEVGHDAGPWSGLRGGRLMVGAALGDELAALVGSRICHDLVNPLGAIANGVELLSMEDPRQGPVAALIGESVASTTARIRFFRMAFGAPSDERIGMPETLDTLAGYLRDRRITLQSDAMGDRARADVRLCFLLVLCIEAAMPRGGGLHLGSDATSLALVADARDLRADPDLWAGLRGAAGLPTLTPALVQFGLARAAIAVHPRPVKLAIDPEARRISARF